MNELERLKKLRLHERIVFTNNPEYKLIITKVFKGLIYTFEFYVGSPTSVFVPI